MELSVLNSQNNEEKIAVRIRNAYKNYGTKNVVLNGLSMTVPEGSIYALLGPSGCGKTTLLKCILGRIQLDYGEIEMIAKTTPEIGYMPQEVTLYSELNIMEIMIFYGRIFHLSYEEIEKRTNYWVQFLDLPNKCTAIEELSGGQQRRVSFAVALLHNPRLLVLDEPTAGIDPLLSENMWNKLVHLAENENKTVIITTHYTEEARRSHTLGLMRNGILLNEESPLQLMNRYNMSNLEDIFLQLSQQQFNDESRVSKTSTNGNNDTKSESADPTLKCKPKVTVEQTFKCSGITVVALLTKHYYWMKRNKLIMLFVLLLPVLDTIIFTACLGNDPIDLKIAIVNEELPEISKCETFPSRGCNFSVPISCRYLKKMQQKTYKLTKYEDLDTAKNAVKKNRAWSLLHIPRNYTNSLYERLTLGRDVSNASLISSHVQVWIDMSNYVIGNKLKKDTRYGCVEFLRELSSDCGWPSRVADVPVQLGKAIFGDNDISMEKSVATAVIAFLQFLLPMSFTLESTLMERKTGSLERNLISGVTLYEIVAAHIIIQFLLLSVQNLGIIIIVYVLFDNPLQVEHLLSMILVMFVTGACSMCYGFFLAVMSNAEQISVFLGVGSIYLMFIAIGMIWQTDAMHWLIRPIAESIPITQCAKALQGLAVKNKTIIDKVVYKSILSNVGWSCIFVLSTLIIIKKREGFGIK